MDEYDRIFRKDLRISTAAHIAAVAVLVCVNFVQGCVIGRKPVDPYEPVEFTVAIPQDEEAGEETPAPEPEPEPIAEDAGVDFKDQIKTPDTPPPPPKKEIQVSTTIVNVKSTTTTTVKQQQPTPKPAQVASLTKEEVQKLLDAGAKPGTETNIPSSEAQRCQLIIKQTLYSAWKRPSAEHDTGRGTEILIKIGASGVVLDRKITRGSGNATFDKSVTDAVASVDKFNNLTKEFIAQHDKGVGVLFSMEK